MKQGLKYDFTLLALVLIPIGVSINFVGYQLSMMLQLPIFLDLIGTIFVSMLAGPWVGAITGLLSNLVDGCIYVTAIPYGIVSMVVAFVSGYCSKWKWYTNIVGVIIACIVLNITSATVSSVITLFVYGGVTGAGTDLVTAVLVTMGDALWNAVLTTNLVTGAFTTFINFAVAWIIVRRLPDRTLVKLNYGAPYIKAKPKEAAI